MINEILLFAGSAIAIAWGIAHITPTSSVVSGFGTISADNKRILKMEWVVEGLALCFIGSLVLFVTVFGGFGNPVSRIVYGACAVMLIVMAIWTQLTGARTPIAAMKICPYVKTAAAILFFLGSHS